MKRQRFEDQDPPQGYNRLENLNRQLQERRQRNQGRHDGHSFAQIEEENNDLQHQVQWFRRENFELQEKLTSWINRNHQIDEQVDELKNQMSAMHGKAKVQHNLILADLKIVKEKAENERRKADILLNEIDILKTEKLNLVQENKSLKNSLDSLEKHSGQIKKAKDVISQISNQAIEKENQIKQFKQEIDSLKKERKLSQLRDKKMDAVKAEAATERKIVEDLNNEIDIS